MIHRGPILLVIFLIIFSAFANLSRTLWEIPIEVDNYLIPNWTGALAYFILATIALFALRALYPRRLEISKDI